MSYLQSGFPGDLPVRSSKGRNCMFNNYCHSCGVPLEVPGVYGNSEHYCAYCTDREGNLAPREQVQKGVAEWLKTWQPNLDDTRAMERAGHYLRSMPAWAE